MNKIINNIFGLLIAFLTITVCHAQKGDKMYADRQFDLNNFRLAADEYSKIYSIKKDYATAKRIAQSLDNILSFGESYEWWKRTVVFVESKKEDYQSLLRAGYRSVPKYNPAGDLVGSPYGMSDFEDFSHPVATNKLSYRSYELNSLENLNSIASDYSLSVFSSRLQFFASNRGEKFNNKKTSVRFDAKGNRIGYNYNKSDWNSYYGIYSKDTEGNVNKIRVEGFEIFHLTDPKLLSNGKMVFTATPGKLKSSDNVVYPGIFYGVYDSLTYTVKDVKTFPYNKTNEYSVISPGVDEEKKRLYFSSNRRGGLGGYDLYYVTYDSNMVFSEPINLGPEINTGSNERDAFSFGDEFYFSSDRVGGFGGLDIYSAKVQGDVFIDVNNIGEPFNSVADDFCFSRQSANKIYFASDRAGGLGYDDLYSVSWSDRSLNVNVVDASGNSLKEGTDLQLIDGMKQINITNTDDQGLVDLTKKGGTYTFTAGRPGYFDQKVSATLAQDQEEIVIVMAPIPFGLQIYQTVIYYDTDKDFLRAINKEELNKITTLMQTHPELYLIVESHTDSRATYQYNQRLSDRRAKSVSKYFDEYSNFGDRVSSTGFGESRLVNDCSDGVSCPESEHQLNRRSELKIIAFPETNKNYVLPIGSLISDFDSKESAIQWFLKSIKTTSGF